MQARRASCGVMTLVALMVSGCTSTPAVAPDIAPAVPPAPAAHPKPYPAALQQQGCTRITTVDVRVDSRAEIKADYMEWYPDEQYDLVITNPPFTLALDYIVTALDDCKVGGFVAMLVRLNFLGSVGRRDFWQHHMPTYCIVHAHRPRFGVKRRQLRVLPLGVA